MKIEAPINGYDIDVMVTGYPGKTVCHGGLGLRCGNLVAVAEPSRQYRHPGT